jgi:antitoxin (DNA-binding transcriptional repressor) of toxin-antitoxin stability system
MSIREKAISKIAAQLTALVGDDSFKIVDGENRYGLYTDTPAKSKRTPHQKQFNFKDTDLYPLIRGLAPGESVTITMPGVPTARIQSVSASVALKAFGPGNAMTSRRSDGGVDVLRLT